VLEASLGAPGVGVIEIRTERTRNVALHREAADAVAAALDELLGDAGAAGGDDAGRGHGAGHEQAAGPLSSGSGCRLAG
jgi:hypothetical protein